MISPQFGTSGPDVVEIVATRASAEGLQHGLMN